MSCAQIHELLAEHERTIKELSELLITELALRDELEYDKELKNSFISLLLSIQKKRRESNADRKKKRSRTNLNQIASDATSPTSETASSVSHCCYFVAMSISVSFCLCLCVQANHLVSLNSFCHL